MSRYGYWVDVSQKLFEAGGTSWIQALPVGTYEHPVYGKMDFTPERIQRFAASVKNRVRGIDPDIDYDHKAQDGKAAGWVRDAEVRPDGLYLNVDWTKPAAESIKAGEYRYFSPEFDDEWTDPSGTKYEDVLFGGALTNRPFLKDLLPVNLSEITTTTQLTGGTLDPKALRAMLKLGEGASDDEVVAAIKKLSESPAPPAPTPPIPAPLTPPSGVTEDALTKLLSEHPVFKELSERVTKAEAAAATADRARQLSETRARLAGLTATQEGRKYVLPPAVIDAIAEGTVADDPAKMSEAFVGSLEQLTKVGFVELGERGRMGSQTEKNATQQLGEMVVAAQAAHFKTTGRQLSYTDAVRGIVRQNPDLYDSYRQDSYAGKEE